MRAAVVGLPLLTVVALIGCTQKAQPKTISTQAEAATVGNDNPSTPSGEESLKIPMNWRTHPRLQGRFHPDHPDDVQVIVHDGGPRITDRRPEAVWVTTTGCDGDLFTGRVLNQPTQLRTVREHQEIRFLAPAGSEHAVMVTDKYLRERPAWTIHPCQKCGFSELFDAPSDLMRVVFPKLRDGETVEAFTSFCPLCGGVQGVEARQATDRADLKASQ